MRILAVNVEIGYGHPNYLDYVIESLQETYQHMEIYKWDVLKEEKLRNRLFWEISKKFYYWGSYGGIMTKLYNHLRNKSNVMKRSFCSVNMRGYDHIIVSHPLLARMLKRVWYLHSEIATPKESILFDVEKIVVPIDYTANKMIEQGIARERIFISGLLIAPELIHSAKSDYEQRLLRIKKKQILTIGLMVSGAYPKPHIRKILSAIQSLQKTTHRLIVFLGANLQKANKLIRELSNNCSRDTSSSSTCIFISGRSRQSYQKRVNRLLPMLDLLVGASHEYTNWAIGLGLPLLTLFPMIGGYALENFNFMQKQGVSYPIRTDDDAKNLDEIVHHLLSSGMLLSMVEHGFNRFDINGAMKIAHWLVKGIS
ncbi:MAG: hypothetical protein ABIK31_02355 [candidate division WOR-3 bacterium]